MNGSYPVKIKADGYKSTTGTVTVNGAGTTLTVNLVKA